MSLPTPTNYSLSYYYSAYNCYKAGTSSVDLVPYGLSLRNPYDLGIKHSEEMIPEGIGAQILSDNQPMPGDLRVTGEYFDSEPQSLQDSISNLIAELEASRKNPTVGFLYDSYLKLGLYNGASTDYFRRYCRFVNAVFPLTPKTHFERADLIELIFRSHDPALYGDTENSKTIPITSGSGGDTVSVAGNIDTNRFIIEIIKDGSDNPTDVTIQTLGGISFTITGSLTALNDKWVVDMFYGKKWLDPASGTNSDISNLFSGRHFNLDYGGDTIFVTETGGSDFTVNVKWLDRYQ
jgi:hypothetical protein